MERNANLTKESLTQIIKMQPGTEAAARAFYQLGVSHLDEDDVDGATSAFRQVPPAWPEWHAKAGFEIAFIYDDRVGDAESAVREYRKVIGSHPETMAAARSYGQMARTHSMLGDEVSAANMRDSAMRLYQRIAETSKDAVEKDEALFLHARACRESQRWDLAAEAYTACRERAIKERDAARRAELDSEIGLLLLDREHHADAITSFKEALDYYRRKSDLRQVVALSKALIQCQVATADVTAEKRSYRSMVEFISRNKLRLAEASKDEWLAPELVRAFLAIDKPADARAVRTKLRRLKSDEAARTLVRVEALIEAEQGPGAVAMAADAG